MFKKDGILNFDFAGTDPQSESSVNFILNEGMFKSFVGFTIASLLDPSILLSEGFYDLIKVHIPEGTLLKPHKPAALSCRAHVMSRLFDVISGLLGQHIPELLTGAGSWGSPHLAFSG